MQVIVDGTPIAYTDEGTGPVLVFVHGWRDSKETWQPISKALRSNHRCIALDLPNFGASGQNAEATTLDAYAHAIRQFLRKTAVDDYTLVGHSMGGQIAVHGVGKAVLVPSKLILVASAGVRDEKQTQKKLLRGLSKPLRHIVPASMKAKFYKQIGSDYDPSLNPVLKSTIDHVLNADVQSVAAGITVPTLLVYGENDTAAPPRFGKRLQSAIKGSQYVEIAGSDHWLHQHSVDDVVRVLQEFMSA